MLKTRLLLGACAIIIVASAFLAAFYLPAGKAALMPTAISISQQTDSYTIRSYNGKIGVFKNDNVVPDQVLDIFTQNLPQSEQKKLQEGIHAKNHDELLTILENYSS